jgi:IS30 family transposase
VFTISDRPAEAADRAVPGHWEGDLILGADHKSAIGTLVERATRFTILLHLPDEHTAEAVAAAMIEAMGELPDHLRRSITWDRGSEMANWQRIQLQLGAPVFFCNLHSRGSVAPTRTPTGCCGFGSKRAPICPGTARPISNASKTSSTAGRDPR